MRKFITVMVMALFLYGCHLIKGNTHSEKRAEEYSQVEIILSDFSKKVTSYYDRKNQSIPANFDEKEFIRILGETYPDQSRVTLIQKNYTIKARPVNNGYSVVLCDLATNNKLIEDIADPRCSLSKVEIRLWDKDGFYPCNFEENWL